MEDKKKRSRRNARYHSKHKKRGGEHRNVIPLFPTNLFESHNVIPIREKPILEYITFSLLALLCVTITGYLIGETTKYFSTIEGKGLGAFLKALLCEGVIIAFSLFQQEDFFSKFMQRFVLVGMVCYSLWSASSNVIVQASQDYQESQTVKQMVKDLETQIRDGQLQIEKYIAQDWLGVARTSQLKLDVLREKLSKLRDRSTTVKTPQIIMNTVLNLVLFRLMLMISNIFCLRRLKLGVRRLTIGFNFT